MTLRIMGRELHAAVNACASIAHRGAIPIIATIHIHAENGKATFTATDTEQTISVRAACAGDFSACINAEALAQKTKLLKSGEVTITGDDKSATVSQGRTRWTIPILPASDFPAVLSTEIKGSSVKAPANFLSAISAALPSAETMGTPRVFLQGVHLSGKHIVSTNGSRMCVIETDADFPEGTIPVQACSRLAILEGDITIAFSANSAIFATEHMTLRTQLIAEAFPDWKRIIPKPPHSASVDLAEFRATVSSAAAIRGDKDKAIPMKISFGDGDIAVMTRNSENEEGNSDMAATVNGPAKWVGFNGSNLTAAISSLASETVSVEYGEYQDPIVVRAIGRDREDYRVIMPWRLPAGFGV
jgi:DNA polymerase III subunit beta